MHLADSTENLTNLFDVFADLMVKATIALGGKANAGGKVKGEGGGGGGGFAKAGTVWTPLGPAPSAGVLGPFRSLSFGPASGDRGLSIRAFASLPRGYPLPILQITSARRPHVVTWSVHHRTLLETTGDSWPYRIFN